MIGRVVSMVAIAAAALASPVVAAGQNDSFDATKTFRRNAIIVSIEGGLGEQHNLENHRHQTNLEFWNTGVRVSVVPFGVSFEGAPLRGAFELGLEPFYQGYTKPSKAHYIGLGAAFRYHFLALGRLVPYVELFSAAGYTDLRTKEIDSEFSFLLQGGPGMSLFLTDRTAVYGGYRFQHVSNGGTSAPNRGFESHSGVFGVSVFFP
jgi:hypothetical protein